MKLLVVLAVLTALSLMVLPVAATYQEENPYNSLWYDSTLTYEEKWDKFNDLIGLEDRLKLDAVMEKGMEIEMEGNIEEKQRLMILFTDVCRGMENTVTDEDYLLLDSLADNGSLYGTMKMQDFISESLSLYNAYGKNKHAVETDVIPSGAVFQELPDKLVYTPDRSYVNSLPAKEKIVEIEKIIEVPYEVEKIIEIPVEVEKLIEVPYEKVVTQTVEVEKPVVVEKEVIKTVPEYHTYYTDRIVYKSFIDSITDWFKGIFS